MPQPHAPDPLEPGSPEPLAFGDVGAWALDPTVAHLNHGSFGAVTLRMLDLVEQRRREVELNPMRFYNREVYAAIARATRAAETFLQAPPDSIALLTNATEAIDLALRTEVENGAERVVTTDHGYPAVAANLDELHRVHGIEHEVCHLPIGATDDEIVETVATAAAEADVVVVDAITSPTGWVMPVARLVAAVRAAGARVIVDGAHVPGHVPVDLTALDPDHWCGNFHKWACAPKAVAAYYVRPDIAPEVPPARPSSDSGGVFPANARWRGTADVGPLLVLPEVLATAAWFTNRQVGQRNSELARTGTRHVAAALGVAPVPTATSNMTLVPIPGLSGDANAARSLQAAIAEDAGVEVAVTRFDGDLFLRLSAHVYVNEGAYDRLAEHIAHVVASQRLL